MHRSFIEGKPARADRSSCIIYEVQSLFSLLALRCCLGFCLGVCALFTLVTACPLLAQEHRWTELNAQVNQLYQQGKFADAVPLAQESVRVAEATFGLVHPNVASSLNNLALLYDEQGHYADAEPLFKRALIIKEKAFGPDHPAVATLLNNLALLYKEQGRYADAEPLFKHALMIDEKALGPNHPDVATDLNNLAGLYDKQGRYAEAEPLYKRALAIKEEVLGPERPDVVASLNNLALLYKQQGRYAEAEPLYRRALAIREKTVGPDHPDVATSLNNLAFLYYKQGRYAEAEPLYKRALAIDEKMLGPDHRDVATDLSNLALVYKEQGRYADAEPLYKRALVIEEKTGGPSPDAATSLKNFAIPTIRVFDANTGRTLLTFNERQPAVSVVFSPDGRRLASYTQDRRITVWDTVAGQALLVIPTEEELIGSIVFSPDGQFIVGASLSSVIIWESKSGLMVRKFYTPPPTAIALTPDGQTLAVAARDSSIRFFDVAVGKETRRLSPHAGTVYCLAFSRDGKLLAIGNDHNTTFIWDLSRNSEPLELAGHTGSVLAVAFSPDSQLLATGSADHTCKIWDIKSGAEIRTLRGHTLSVIALAFDRTGHTLVTGSRDHTLKVWETSNWSEVSTISSMQGVVSSLAFSPDGTRIASGTTLAHPEDNSLYMLAIGVSRYSNREFDLEYPAKDASDLAHAFQEGSKGPFARMSCRLLTDSNASRGQIIAAIQGIVNEARPADTFIFYFAGHSVATEDQYFLLPSDAELGNKSELAAVRSTGISSRELKLWLDKITAKQQFVLLDTADSATVVDALDSRFKHQGQELTELLGRNSVIVGLRNNFQFAVETNRSQNGLFADALLDGLSGGRPIPQTVR